jgi:hypothetical protein
VSHTPTQQRLESPSTTQYLALSLLTLPSCRLFSGLHQTLTTTLSCTITTTQSLLLPQVPTWLGDNFDSALLNGALMEALRYMKGEQADFVVYEKMYTQSLGLLKQLGDGKQRQDSYRNGQYRMPVS